LKTFSQRATALECVLVPLPNPLSFRVHHSEIQSKPIIINKQNYSQDEKLFVGETISDVAVKKFYT
jgi:hypothetical protein